LYTEKLLKEAGKTGVILGADCTVPPDIDLVRFNWVRDAAATL
jgi:uroporphyrinogen decarboxylase